VLIVAVIVHPVEQLATENAGPGIPGEISEEKVTTSKRGHPFSETADMITGAVEPLKTASAVEFGEVMASQGDATGEGFENLFPTRIVSGTGVRDPLEIVTHVSRATLVPAHPV
jgi:hypothetical protein